MDGERARTRELHHACGGARHRWHHPSRRTSDSTDATLATRGFPTLEALEAEHVARALALTGRQPYARRGDPRHLEAAALSLHRKIRAAMSRSLPRTRRAHPLPARGAPGRGHPPCPRRSLAGEFRPALRRTDAEGAARCGPGRCRHRGGSSLDQPARPAAGSRRAPRRHRRAPGGGGSPGPLRSAGACARCGGRCRKPRKPSPSRARTALPSPDRPTTGSASVAGGSGSTPVRLPLFDPAGERMGSMDVQLRLAALLPGAYLSLGLDRISAVLDEAGAPLGPLNMDPRS
jgi:hypothetical protein